MVRRVAFLFSVVGRLFAGFLAVSTFAQTGGPGSAITFNGSNQRGSFDRVISNNFAIEFWFKSTQVAGGETQWTDGMGIVDASVPGLANDFGISFGNGKLLCGIGSPTQDRTIKSGFLADGLWHHVVFSRVGAAFGLYVDGLPVASDANGTNRLDASGVIMVGCLNTTNNFFNGSLDDLRIGTGDFVPGFPLTPTVCSGQEGNLMAYFRFDEPGGSVAIDRAPAAGVNNMTLFNNPVRVVSTAGLFYPLPTGPGNGFALDFDGIDDYVEVTPGASLVLRSNVTFEAWVYPRTAKCNTILSRGNGSNTNTDYIFQVGYDGTNCGVMKIGFFASGAWTSSTGSVPLNTWTHVAVVYGPFDIKFYINGAMDSSFPPRGGFFQSGSQIYIGRQGSSCNCNFFDGMIDEVRIWNTQRTGDEIPVNMRRPLTGSEPYLAAYYPFDLNAGAVTMDSSGRGNTGVLRNRVMPVPSTMPFSVSATTNGANPMVTECHTGFADPGVTAFVAPRFLVAGFDHSMAIKANGNSVRFGDSPFNESNAPLQSTGLVAAASGFSHDVGLRADRSLTAWGNNNNYGQLNIPPGATNIMAIAAGEYDTLALRRDGTVFAWGRNDFTQTNIPPTATNVVAIAAGFHHNLALRADGTVVAWGENSVGQCNVPPQATNVVAITAGQVHSVALRRDGQLVGWGNNNDGQLTVPPGLTNIVSIAAGGYQTYALCGDGNVVPWGNNAYNQLNIPFAATEGVFVAAASSSLHALLLKSDGGVVAWGLNASFQTVVPGNLNSNGFFFPPAQLNTNAPGTYNVTYGNAFLPGVVGRMVTVADTIPATLTLNGSNFISLLVGTPFVDPGATAIDLCAGDRTTNIVKFSSVNTNIPGTYSVFYVVSDSYGNVSTTQRVVQVKGFTEGAAISGMAGGTIEWGDYDGDGLLDLIITGEVSGFSARTEIWKNYGGGYFQNINAPITPVRIGSASWGDFDRDGDLDILLMGETLLPGHTSPQDILEVWRNDGNGNFENIGAGLEGTTGKAGWADFDNDGWPDIIVARYGHSQIWRNLGNGTFTNVNNTLTSVSAGAFAVGDLDNDGLLDIVLTGSDFPFSFVTEVWHNLGHFNFEKMPVSIPGVISGSLAIGDLDGDGKADIVLSGTYQGGGPTQGRFQVWRNLGNWTFTNLNTVPAQLGGNVALGDVNNDGLLDIAVSGRDTSLQQTVTELLINQGGGVFSNADVLIAGSGSIALGDFDNDGRLDVAMSGGVAFNSYLGGLWNNVAILTNVPPTPPSGLTVTETASGAVLFNWNSATDSNTPGPALTYNVRVGSTPGGNDMLSPMAFATNGWRMLPRRGNAEQRRNLLLTTPVPGRRYYWSVQSIDNGFASSPFAAESSFMLAPRFSGEGRRNDGAFQARFLALANTNYLIQSSSNLTQWSDLLDFSFGADGPALFTDPSAKTLPRRFYRLRQY